MLTMLARTSLIGVGLAVVALAGAGCGDGKDVDNSTSSSTTIATPEPDQPSPTPAQSSTPTPKATPSPTPTPTPKPTTTPTATKTPAAAGGSGSEIVVDADPQGQLAFTEDSLTAKAGTVKITFNNKAPVPHNVAIRQGTGQPIVETKTISGATATAETKLDPGTYEFYCAVPGHEQAGMKGTLTVK
ncbi:MAG: hypothetical protein QOF76_5325 [Solirubrobacteraceae bacterium]|nr:hypothetical protein [Solirubrobacteraceae bacterium]